MAFPATLFLRHFQSNGSPYPIAPHRTLCNLSYIIHGNNANPIPNKTSQKASSALGINTK